MSVFERKSPPPGPTPRKRRPFVRDPELPRVFIVALVAGVVLGAAVWYVGSSRGSDLVEVQQVASLLAVALLIAGSLAALARATMVSDLRLAVALIAVLVGGSLGSAVAFRVTPGDTTDGDAAIVGPPTDGELDPAGPIPTPDPITGGRYGGPVRCNWDSTHTILLSLTSRRAFAVKDPPPFPARVTMDLVAGTITVERVRLDTDQLIATYAAVFPRSRESTGNVTIAAFTRTVAPGLDSDTTLLLDLLSDLNGWIVFWDCPHFA